MSESERAVPAPQLSNEAQQWTRTRGNYWGNMPMAVWKRVAAPNWNETFWVPEAVEEAIRAAVPAPQLAEAVLDAARALCKAELRLISTPFDIRQSWDEANEARANAGVVLDRAVSEYDAAMKVKAAVPAPAAPSQAGADRDDPLANARPPTASSREGFIVSARTHEHTSLWTHFGKYAPPEHTGIHYHPCIKHAASCMDSVMGPGRDCDGKRETHWRETVRGDEWVRLTEPLVRVEALSWQI